MELTSVGIEAAAERLPELATNGSGTPWSEASEELQENFRDFALAIIDEAYKAQLQEQAHGKHRDRKGT